MTTINDLIAMCWPAEALGLALEELARRAGLRRKPSETFRPPDSSAADGDGIREWLEFAAPRFNLDATPVETNYGEVTTFLRKCGPAILRIDFDDRCGYLVVISAGKAIRVLTPDLRTKQVSVDVVQGALCGPLEASIRPEIERLAGLSSLEERHREDVVQTILKQHLGTAQIGSCWLLRLSEGASLWHHFRDQRLPSRTALFITAHLIDSALMLAGWAMIGRAILQGRLDAAWLTAWALALLSRIPFQLIGTWIEGTIYLRGGALLKRRLLAGSLRLQPEEVRKQGTGQLLGRVIESGALESLTLSGGLSGMMSAVDLGVATLVLGWAAGNWMLSLMLIAWAGLVILLAWRQYRARESWTVERLKITNDLVESMIGHRTRLAQQPRRMWHELEDAALSGYVDASRKVDRRVAHLTTTAPRGWLILGLLGIVPALLAGNVNSTTLAITFGGILLAHAAFTSLTRSLTYFAAARIAWDQVRVMFEGVSGFDTSRPLHEVQPARHDGNEVVLEAHQLTFQHEGRNSNVLKSCDVKINRGDHVLLEGPSGSGKSTLAAIFAGLRVPQAGLILLNGVDRHTLGLRNWRRLIAAAPQFHENHVLSGTFAFNLLMGRQWPPTTEDCVEAERVCREVGLGDLLDRMPGGLFQVVGETGWQLSHGERSRLFLARTLLQGPDNLILDETLGSLDPESIQLAMDCVFKRAKTLILIAHP